MIRKRFGQHFLEPAWVDKVVRAIAPLADETFIEIGPGRGALTRSLAARAKTVAAFEIDRDLAAELSATAPPNLTVIQGDFLEVEATGARLLPKDSRLPAPDRIRVAGNLPYNIASPILFKLVEFFVLGVPLVDATVMLQREVADRLTAAPGSRQYGVLSILIRRYARADVMLKLPPGAFRPPPAVNSALVRLRFHAPVPQVQDAATFAGLVQAVFTRRRKTLANALLAYKGRPPASSPAETLAAADLDGRRRPETLSIMEFGRLADAYAGKGRAVL